MTDNKWLRNSFVWVIIMVAMLVLFFTFLGNRNPSQEISISKVVEEAKAGNIAKIVTHEDSYSITLCSDLDCKQPTRTSQKEPDGNLRKYLQDAGVPNEKMPEITVEKSSSLGN